MTDTEQLKASCDLRRLVEQDLGEPLARGGRAYLWKCPFHHERRGLSFAVWADGYYCFGKCDRGGDALDWLQRYRKLSFADAVRLLGEPFEPSAPNRISRQRSAVEAGSAPPDAAWQEAAERVVDYAESVLWSSRGEQALIYLRERGLTSPTIRGARLGLVPGGGWTTIAGLKVPCGITIPWFAAGDLWAVKVRRAADEPKYAQIAGGKPGLYNADALINRQFPALICEGEFDTLIAAQEAGQIVAAVSLGSATGRLNPWWYSDLAQCPTILVAYDNDEAGQRGAQRLRRISSRVRVIGVPRGKDITEFHAAGGDLFMWIESEMAGVSHGE